MGERRKEQNSVRDKTIMEYLLIIKNSLHLISFFETRFSLWEFTFMSLISFIEMMLMMILMNFIY